MESPLYPLRLTPFLSRPIWGGNQLAARFGKGSVDSGTIGESWEIYEGNTVLNGPLRGRTLADLTKEFGRRLTGPTAPGAPAGRFPLLIKLIDAAQQLSVQVHPDDRQAQQLEGEPFGKTEAWYILDAAADARLVYGLRHPVTKEHLRTAAASGALEHDLAYLPVESGDVVFVPAGTIHAIGAGILLYEIQQTSKTTYRLYDWNRRGDDGKPRELHIDKAVEVARLRPPEGGKVHGRELKPAGDARRRELMRCPYFELQHVSLDGTWTIQPGGATFGGLTCVTGSATVSSPDGAWPDEALCAGSSLLIPASLDSCTVRSDGDAEMLFATIPRS